MSTARGSLQNLVKVGAKVGRDGRYVIFRMPEVAVLKELFQEILQLIDGLRQDRLKRKD